MKKKFIVVERKFSDGGKSYGILIYDTDIIMEVSGNLRERADFLAKELNKSIFNMGSLKWDLKTLSSDLVDEVNFKK